MLYIYIYYLLGRLRGLFSFFRDNELHLCKALLSFFNVCDGVVVILRLCSLYCIFALQFQLALVLLRMFLSLVFLCLLAARTENGSVRFCVRVAYCSPPVR